MSGDPGLEDTATPPSGVAEAGIPETIRPDEALHKLDLIEADLKEELRKRSQCLFAKIAAPIQVVPAGLITGHQVPLVLIDLPRQASSNRPEGACIQCLKQRRVRHQASDAAVAVDERMNP